MDARSCAVSVGNMRDSSSCTVPTTWIACTLPISTPRSTNSRAASRSGRRTLKRWRRMLTQAQALAAQVMSEPGHAYAYRRRRYRRLLAQDRDLRNLLWLLGLALPFGSRDARAEAFRVLEQRLGFSPPSRHEAAALRKHLSPGDAAAYHLSLQTCTCAVCALMRSGAAPHDDTLAEALQGCPCGVCFAFRRLAERAGPVPAGIRSPRRHPRVRGSVAARQKTAN